MRVHLHNEIDQMKWQARASHHVTWGEYNSKPFVYLADACLTTKSSRHNLSLPGQNGRHCAVDILLFKIHFHE